MTDVSESIETNAQSPQSAEVDGVRVTLPSLRDQIEADKYLRGHSARANPAAQLFRVKIVPPGTV